MGLISLELISNGLTTKQQATRPADRGLIKHVSIVLVSGTVAYGALFARLSVAARSGGNLLYVANLAAGYISASSNIFWSGEFPLSATDELVLDSWSSTAAAVVRATVSTDRRSI